MSAIDWRNLPRTDLPIPAGQYAVFIRSVGTNPSKTGKPMATLECEILAPESVEHGGQVVKTVGRKFKQWVVFGESRRSYEDAQTILAPELPGGELESPVIPDQMPAVLATAAGKVMSACQLESEERYQTNAMGQPVVDPATGQPKLLGHNIRIKSFSGAVPPEALGFTVAK